jgi:hypothetical protein
MSEKSVTQRAQSLSPSSRRQQTINTNKASTNKSKLQKTSGRVSKGSEDPILTHNRFDDLEDMEGEFSEGESQSSRPPFKPTQILPPTG